jgi:transposase
MWLTRRLTPDFKTIADFRRDNGRAIRNACRQFVVLCRKLDLFSQSIVAIDGSLVLGGEQPRPQLHRRQDQATHGAD